MKQYQQRRTTEGKQKGQERKKPENVRTLTHSHLEVSPNMPVQNLLFSEDELLSCAKAFLGQDSHPVCAMVDAVQEKLHDTINEKDTLETVEKMEKPLQAVVERVNDTVCDIVATTSPIKAKDTPENTIHKPKIKTNVEIDGEMFTILIDTVETLPSQGGDVMTIKIRPSDKKNYWKFRIHLLPPRYELVAGEYRVYMNDKPLCIDSITKIDRNQGMRFADGNGDSIKTFGYFHRLFGTRKQPLTYTMWNFINEYYLEHRGITYYTKRKPKKC